MSSAPDLDSLDAARGGPFRYRHDGEIYVAPDPVDMPFEVVLTHLLVDTMAGPTTMTLWQARALLRAWAAHYDLPDGPSAQRLCYVVNKYRDDLAYDLLTHARVDLGEAWRGRRWRTLLATVDRLPSHTYFAEAVSKDSEHAKMLADSMAAAGDASESSGPAAPPLRSWTPELRMLTNIHDAVRHLNWATFAVQAGQKAGPPPAPSPTPNSLVDVEAKRSVHRRRTEKHKALTKRLLPHKQD